ncbi:MAG: 3-deoxy-D-manno-octulosonic acid kinase [Pseudomonadota bacterium]
MAESSAKQNEARDGVHRWQSGPRVVLYVKALAAIEPEQLFDPDAWPHIERVGTGRGANWFIGNGQDECVLRHFQRGGALARVLGDKYWFRGEQAVRSMAEFRLLRVIHEKGLPVPEPLAAGFHRHGRWYTAQLITRRIPDARAWSELVTRESGDATSDKRWAEIGATIARLHGAGVDHVDLNAHNILVDARDAVFIIDFDKCVERPPERDWQQANIARLKRSLLKILPDSKVLTRGWPHLLAAYERSLLGSR